MKHSVNHNKVVLPVVLIGLARMAVDVIVAKKLYGKGADDQWNEMVDIANSDGKGIRPVYDEPDTTGKPVLGLVPGDYVQELMNAKKGEM